MVKIDESYAKKSKLLLGSDAIRSSELFARKKNRRSRRLNSSCVVSSGLAYVSKFSSTIVSVLSLLLFQFVSYKTSSIRSIKTRVEADTYLVIGEEWWRFILGIQTEVKVGIERIGIQLELVHLG